MSLQSFPLKPELNLRGQYQISAKITKLLNQEIQ